MKELEFMRKIVDSVYNGIVVIDSQGTIVVWNKAASRILGMDSRETIGYSVNDVLPETDVMDVLITKQEVRGKKVCINGKTLISNRSLIIDGDDIMAVAAVFQEINDLEDAAKELDTVKALNKELEAIIDSSYDGIWVSDGEGNTLRVNKSYEKFSGVKAEEVVGHNLKDLVKQGFVTDSAALHVLTQKRPVTVIHTIKTGKKAMVTGNPVFDEKGNIYRVVSNVRDITELRRLEEELSLAKNMAKKYKNELEQMRRERLEFENIISTSPQMQQCLERAIRAAKVNATVLLTGESGVGKGVVARLVHEQSERKNKPFTHLNCAAIPENLIESELFGFKKGSFTGANTQGKKGLFELAKGGTLFLDEIGEVGINLQAKLLQAIQDQIIIPIGSTEQVKLDVRIIAASNRNLGRMVEQGDFRQDLYYRLKVMQINIPPLRERKADIPPMLEFFLKKYNKKYKTEKTLSGKLKQFLNDYDWMGNCRELENMIETLVIMAGEVITMEELRMNFPEIDQNSNHTDPQKDIPSDLRNATAWIEKKLISEALEKHGTTRAIAKALGVAHSTVVRKMKKYNLSDNWDDNDGA